MIDQVRTAAHQNWDAFWDFHLGSWDGRWVRYNPLGEVSENFLSTRKFVSNTERSIIHQHNQYFYHDEQIIEKKWNYNIQDHCRDDGFMHPASDYMRGLAFANGSAAWLVPRCEAEQYFPIELFLASKNLRLSVGMLYDTSGELQRVACIREHRSDFGASPWCDSIQLVPKWNVEANWQGISQVVDLDLSRSFFHDSFYLNHSAEDNEYFFPDNIVLRCPGKVPAHQAFTISALWLESDFQIKTISASYGSNSQLIDVRHQQFTH